MNRIKQTVFILVAALFIFQATALAKLVSGKVTAADPGSNKLSITMMNAGTGGDEKADIWVNSDASFSGVNSLGELKPGDEVWVEAEADAQGNWKASKLTKA